MKDLIDSESNIATGSCLWKHKWTKWEQFDANMLSLLDFKTRYVEMKQRRYCVKCGKIQIAKLDE